MLCEVVAITIGIVVIPAAIFLLIGVAINFLGKHQELTDEQRIDMGW